MALRNRKVKNLSHVNIVRDIVESYNEINHLAIRFLLQAESVKQPEDSKVLLSGDSGPEAVMEKNTEADESHDNMEEIVMEKTTETNEIQETDDETVMETNTDTNQIQETMEETVMEKNTESNVIQ